MWCPFWGGAHLTRFTAAGVATERVDVPVLCPTSIAFGGPDLRTMYVTSATRDLGDQQLDVWPLSGSVLQCTVDTPGLPSTIFRTPQMAIL